jgi:hypothetical protein
MPSDRSIWTQFGARDHLDIEMSFRAGATETTRFTHNRGRLVPILLRSLIVNAFPEFLAARAAKACRRDDLS